MNFLALPNLEILIYNNILSNLIVLYLLNFEFSIILTVSTMYLANLKNRYRVYKMLQHQVRQYAELVL